MHRSGTSMITNLLLEISDDYQQASSYIQGDIWNQRGYFENMEFVILNNCILIGNFAHSSALRRYPPEKRSQLIRFFISISNLKYLMLIIFPAQIHKNAMNRMSDMVELGKQYQGQIIKDPRFSLLIDYWNQATNINRVVFCFRHPYEVMCSLKKKYSLLPQIGYQLWSFHNVQFLKASHSVETIFINFNNFFDPMNHLNEMKRLYCVLDKEFDQQQAEIIKKKIILGKFKNQVYINQKIPHRVQTIYSRLLELHADEERWDRNLR